METEIKYPTEIHQHTAEQVTNFFSGFKDVRAALLTCSCARGKASKDSCLDMAILFSPQLSTGKRDEIIALWDKEHAENKLYKDFSETGEYSHVDLEFIDGNFREGCHEWTSGPDGFELEIGNFLAYSKPLYKNGEYFDQLRSDWLPYYNDSQRERRLKMVREFCLNNLHHIPLYNDRGLYFQCFNRLYHAVGEFLQALFIAKRTYPIAYDKWIKEQLCDLLQLPDLYEELVELMQYERFESSQHKCKAKQLESLVDRYCNE